VKQINLIGKPRILLSGCTDMVDTEKYIYILKPINQ